MTIPFSSVSPTAIIIAAIMSIALGFTWYSPLLFGNVWMKEMKIKRSDSVTNEMYAYMALGMLSTIFSIIMLNILFIMLDPSTLRETLLDAFVMWLAFSVPYQLGEVAWSGRSFTMAVINLGYWLIMLLLTAATLWLMNGFVVLPG